MDRRLLPPHAHQLEPSLAEKILVIRRHLDLCAEHQAERTAAELMRQRISWYGKSMGHVKPLKEAIRTAPDLDTMRRVTDEWLDWARSNPEASTTVRAARGAGPLATPVS